MIRFGTFAFQEQGLWGILHTCGLLGALVKCFDPEALFWACNVAHRSLFQGNLITIG